MGTLKKAAALLLCLLFAAAGLTVAAADYPELTPEELDPAPSLLTVMTLNRETGAGGPATQTDLPGEDFVEEDDPLGVFTINHGSRNSKKIAITMDDMFDTEWTWKTLALCKQYGITMTFFPIGRSLKEEDRDTEGRGPGQLAGGDRGGMRDRQPQFLSCPVQGNRGMDCYRPAGQVPGDA